MNIANLRIAVVHDWLVISGGAEKVLEQILLCFPQAHVYSIVDFLPENQRKFLGNASVTSSFIQSLPLSKRYYWYYLPLMPLAIEQFDLSDYDIVISSSHAVAKGVITHPHQLHISYIHSPVRFAWDLQNYYLNVFGYQRGIKSLLARTLFHYLRLWDSRTANGIDLIIANSRFIARRIKKTYGCESTIIYPPVDVERFSLSNSKQDFYLTASFMNPFKKIDLIVEAFAELPNQKLIVIGDGPEFKRIQAKATSNVELVGYQETDTLKSYMQQARAFIFAAPEDFGIIMAEAQACGTPVIAYGRGGATEIIQGLDQEHPTGVFFPKQNIPSLIQAIEQFEQSRDLISPETCRQNALRFAPNFFQESFRSIVDAEWLKFCHN
ncbi:glycosyltransferase family 4 protein [Pseudanabaena sp. FACHB-2040]|uniref:glycosyltransferase family 4 protein n=1 Tax=Pseudanabaena sp. FACHB-2040 TaxID=2692859 RepID=UPI001686C710|nr:glycosyltransferase family 4 protein [Pseudanabaena sp. FACHB-2040]MBD2255942.1 glycosyltransferase family 4 protein [Pseudanabaena sp. FACHB-2040]